MVVIPSFILSLQAFKFPDSMNVHFQCVVQVCRGACPNPQCGGSGDVGGGAVLGGGGGGGRVTSPNTDSYGAPQGPAIDR